MLDWVSGAWYRRGSRALRQALDEWTRHEPRRRTLDDNDYDYDYDADAYDFIPSDNGDGDSDDDPAGDGDGDDLPTSCTAR